MTGGINWALFVGIVALAVAIVGLFIGIPPFIVAWRELTRPAPGAPAESRPPVTPTEIARANRLPNLIALAVAIVATAVAVPTLIAGARHSDQPKSPPPTNHTSHPHIEEAVPELAPEQLAAILVPKASYERLFPEFYDILGEDSEAQALQGGVPHLKLCNAVIRAAQLGPDSASAYISVPIGVRPAIYFGSDAASFATRQAAERWLSTAAEEGPGCGWRDLGGARLDNQAVRLTTDKQNSEGFMLHVDVILVRDRASVVEVATETTLGSHSADANALARGAAQRLARAVQQG